MANDLGWNIGCRDKNSSWLFLTDRASTIPSNIRGCQSSTWSAGQKKIRGTSTKFQREQKKHNEQTRNDKKKGTTTKYRYQKGSPICSHMGSTVQYRGEAHRYAVHSHYNMIDRHAGTPKPQSIIKEQL